MVAAAVVLDSVAAAAPGWAVAAVPGWHGAAEVVALLRRPAAILPPAPM
jgi:hypothetical protein